jgi:hypothetical protein
MPNLGAEAIRAWRRNLPPDVRGVVIEDMGGDEVRIQSMIDRLTAAPLSQAAGIIRSYDADVAAMGRARRIRLLAWLMGRVTDDSQIRDVLAIFQDDDDATGEGDIRPVAARLLFEDVRLLAQHVVAPRKAKREIDPTSLDLVLRSSIAVGLESTPPGGL